MRSINRKRRNGYRRVALLLAAAFAGLAFDSARAQAQPSPAPSLNLPLEWTSFRLNTDLNPVLAPAQNISLQWTFRTKAGISSSPTVSGDTVFIAGNDHHVYALDIRNGALRWDYAASDEVMTAPLVYENTVIVGEGNQRSDRTMFFPPDYMLMGDGSNSIIGLDAQTGKELWRRRVPGTAMPTGAIVGGNYIEHDGAGMIFAFGAKDGTYRYRAYVGSSASMVAANNYRGSAIVTGGVFPNAEIAIDGATGNVLWRTPFPAQDGGFNDCPPASDGRTIFATYNAHPSDSKYGFVGYQTPAVQHAYALDGDSGRVLWNVALVRGVLPINNSTAIPMLYDKVLYLGSAMVPKMFALDAVTGKELWTLTVEGPVKGGVVASDGTIYFGDLAGYFWAVDARSGAVKGKTKMIDGFNVGSPIIVGSSLIVGTATGYVLAMPLRDLSGSSAQSPSAPISNATAAASASAAP